MNKKIKQLTADSFIRNFCNRVVLPLVMSLFSVCVLAEDDKPLASAYDFGFDELAKIKVVSVEKVNRKLQETPLTVHSFEGEELRENGIVNISGLTQLVPSLHIGFKTNDMDIALRGINSSEGAERGDASIGFHLDGIYFPRAYSMTYPFFDLDRAEVLSGPAGTIWGRNATGGVINIISKKPDTETSKAFIHVRAGNYNQRLIEGAFNLPLNEAIAIRTAIYANKHDGFRENNPVKDGDDDDVVALRISASYQPSDDLYFLLTADHLNHGGVGSVFHNPEFGFADRFALNSEGDRDDTNQGLRLEVNWHHSFADLTYLTSYRDTDISWRGQDWDGSEADLIVFNFFNDSKEYQHELRFTSNEDVPLSWLVGLFYFKEEQDVFAPLDTPIIGPDVRLFFEYNNDVGGEVYSKSRAVFAQGNYKLTDSLNFTLGYRRTLDEKSRAGLFTFQNTDGSTTSSPFRGGDKWNSNDWKVGIDWDVTPLNMLYFFYTSGYKVGGYNDGFDRPTFEPEQVDGFELGLKSQLFDDHLRVNAAAFVYDYKDIQASVDAGLRGNLTANAGAADILGGDVELIALLTPNDRLQWNLGYLDTEFGSALFRDEADGVEYNIEGNSLVKAPEWTSNINYQHTFILEGGSSVKAKAQIYFESESYFRPFNFDSEKQGSYTTTNLFLSYIPANTNWKIQLFVNNLEDKLIITRAKPSFDISVRSYAQPRTAGIQISYQFASDN